MLLIGLLRSQIAFRRRWLSNLKLVQSYRRQKLLMPSKVYNSRWRRTFSMSHIACTSSLNGKTGKWPRIINEVGDNHRQQQEPSLYSSAAPKGVWKPHCSHIDSNTQDLLHFSSVKSLFIISCFSWNLPVITLIPGPRGLCRILHSEVLETFTDLF